MRVTGAGLLRDIQPALDRFRAAHPSSLLAERRNVDQELRGLGDMDVLLDVVPRRNVDHVLERDLHPYG